MRDHPDHIKPVISGLWGFKNFLDRKFTKYMLNIFTDKIINKWYKQDEISSKSDERPSTIRLNKYNFIFLFGLLDNKKNQAFKNRRKTVIYIPFFLLIKFYIHYLFIKSYSIHL